MPLILFLIFIILPIAEIAVFIEAGRLIGVLPTIALTIGTAIAGSVLMRMQGFTALTRFVQSLGRGEMPVTPVIDGVGILMAGLLLLTPGFVTDLMGFLLFIPPIRRTLARWLINKAIARGRVHIRTFGNFGSFGQAPPEPPPSGPSSPRGGGGGGGGFRKADDVVDADFETIDPDEGGKGEPLRPEETNARRTNSPWKQR
jgi:UPF0716 protein FxsA